MPLPMRIRAKMIIMMNAEIKKKRINCDQIKKTLFVQVVPTVDQKQYRVYVDLKKGFDTIHHIILIDKLNKYNISLQGYLVIKSCKVTNSCIILQI